MKIECNCCEEMFDKNDGSFYIDKSDNTKKFQCDCCTEKAYENFIERFYEGD